MAVAFRTANIALGILGSKRPMSEMEGATIIRIAREVDNFAISTERAAALAVEIGSYLKTIQQKSHNLTFDDVPTDFDAELERRRR